MTRVNSPIVRFDQANLSAFGSLEAVEMTPVIQGDFVYGLNTQVWSPAVVSGTGATVDTNASRLRIQSGTNAAGYAYITTRRPVRYRAGQGMAARFTPIFTAGVANSLQLFGMGTLVTNAPYDGYFFGFNGTSFGVVHYIAGTPTWTSQADWNGDKCNGSAGSSFTLNPTYGTPVMIKYPYLGYGNIEFFLQNPTTGRWVLAHTIRYANTTATTQVTNPTLQFIGFTLNSGATSNQIMYCASVGVFISGLRTFANNPKWASDNYKATVTAETNILSLRNATTYNGVPNRGLIRVNSISIGGDSASGTVVIARLRIGATVGGSPSFTPINGSTADGGVTVTSGNSVASVDTAGTTATAGTLIYNLTIAAPGNIIIDLTPFNIFVSPGEILTISGFGTASSTIAVAVNWTEDI